MARDPHLPLREGRTAGSQEAVASSQRGTAAVNFATVRRNLRTAAKGVPAARRKAFFAYFLLPLGQKVRRLAGRDPPVLKFA